MKDLKFTKDKVTCDFEEAENLENIKSGESISTIFGKIKRWFPEVNSSSQNANNITKLKSEIDDGAIGVFRKWCDNEGIPGGLVRKGATSTASGMGSIALGTRSEASGMYSIAGGFDTTAQSYCCSAFGFGTVAAAHSQFVFGRCNKISYSDQGYVLIIGNGNSDSDRSNALTLDWDGNLWTAGDVTATNYSGDNVSLFKTSKTVSQLCDSLGMTKSKNLLKNTVGTATQNGITFTHNSDGSVTCNGTATADTNYRYIITLPIDTSFILSGCPTGGSTSTYNLFAMDADTWSKIYRDTSSSVIFNTGTCKTWHFIIRVANGQTVSNMTFYPMLRRADIYADDVEYEPYVDDLQTQINELRELIMSRTAVTNTEEV